MKDFKELVITVLFGWLGIHRFMRGEIGLGILYFCTFGLFGIGYVFDIIACIYYFSNNFTNLKNSINENTKKCNELNDHIEELKNSYIDIRQIDYGQANYVDNSRYNFKRPQLKKIREKVNVYDCSLTICKNAQNQPFKYICKYFNIKPTEENLEKFEAVLNDFCAAEQGKILLKNERDNIINGISKNIPLLIRTFDKKNLIRKLGFEDIDFSNLYFPKYTFRYISAGGNSSMSCGITLDINNLERFVKYLADLVKFRKTAEGQRALMTTALRKQIKERDDYTCKCCGLSVREEPNLLLEIDHIIPVSKGGLTTESNLQTLCWRCNRSKGAKTVYTNNQY